MTIRAFASTIGRRAVLAGVGLAALFTAVPALAQDLSGELVILQWQGGTDAELWQKLEADFAAKNPGVTVRELVVFNEEEITDEKIAARQRELLRQVDRVKLQLEAVKKLEAKYGERTTAADRSMAEAFNSYVANFVRAGDPNGPGLPPWPRFEPSHFDLMHFSPDDGPVFPNHSNRMLLNEPALATGIAMHVAVALRFFAR